ncbi:MAG: alpha/beta fold hydrolase [Gemmatimonadales bacterium]
MSGRTEVKTVRTAAGTYTVHRDAPHATGPFIVFLAGGPGFSCAPERAILSPLLLEHANIVWFDQLGSLGSPPHDPSLVSWKRLADDVAFLIRTEAGGSAHILAHSGGTISTHYLHRAHPEVIKSVTWLAPVPRLAGAFGGILRRQIEVGHLRESDLTADERAALRRLLVLAENEWGRSEVDLLLGLLPKVEDFFAIYWRDRGARARYDALAPEGHVSGLAFRMLTGEYLENGKTDIPDYSGIPALALPGEGDPIAPWEIHGKAMVQAIPHLRIETILNGYHFPHIEATEAVVRIWAEFALR